MERPTSRLKKGSCPALVVTTTDGGAIGRAALMKGKFGSGALLVAGPHQRTGVRVFQAEPLKKRRGGGRWAAKSVTLGALLRFHIIVVGRSSHPSREPFLLLMRSAGNARPTFCLSLPLIIPLTSGSKELTKKPLYSVCVCVLI